MSAQYRLRPQDDKQIQSVLYMLGFTNINKIASTLQGGIWEGTKTGQVTKVIKATNKHLHKHSISKLCNGNKSYKIVENILMEQAVLQYLANQTDTPQSIVKYYDFFQSNSHYFLIMEHAGRSLFTFVIKAHKLISNGNIDISEWYKVTRIIFKQLLSAVEYLHSKNVFHFDISLENVLINDLQIKETKCPKTNKSKITFIVDNLQIKLVDFGLSEFYAASDKQSNFVSNKYCGKPNYQSPEIHARKQNFDAKCNDIWCIGVCFWMITTGVSPFKIAHKSDPSFVYIMNGHMKQLLKSWHKLQYVNNQWLDLMQSFFKYENTRIVMQEITNHPWLN